jgi:hypothetical protein
MSAEGAYTDQARFNLVAALLTGYIPDMDEAKSVLSAWKQSVLEEDPYVRDLVPLSTWKSAHILYHLRSRQPQNAAKIATAPIDGIDPLRFATQAFRQMGEQECVSRLRARIDELSTMT